MASAEEHIETAEQLLDLVRDQKGIPLAHLVGMATIAQSHAVVAQAISISQMVSTASSGG